MRMALALLLVLTASGCHLHPSNNDGGAINLAVSGMNVVVARGSEGIEVINGLNGDVVSFIAPRGESESYDDVAADAGIVLALDAECDRLSSFRLAPSGRLEAVMLDLEVATGPYSGLGFSNGKAIVSGGTNEMTFVDVAADGSLAVAGTLSAFRGQPDATMIPGGGGAVMSTHFSNSSDEFVDGAEFGVTTVDMTTRAVVATSGMKGAGFTGGGGTPASWPVRASVQQQLIFVAHGGGLDILRLDANLGLSRASHLDLSVEATDVFAIGDTAYVTGVPARVIAVDVSDPEQPKVTTETRIDGEEANPTAVVASGNNLYVAANAAGLVKLSR